MEDVLKMGHTISTKILYRRSRTISRFFRIFGRMRDAQLGSHTMRFHVILYLFGLCQLVDPHSSFSSYKITLWMRLVPHIQISNFPKFIRCMLFCCWLFVFSFVFNKEMSMIFHYAILGKLFFDLASFSGSGIYFFSPKKLSGSPLIIF
ncbi:hypothetical protein H5410_037092 [Solanum commersonii]|uniref:Uncharacterized protein n=1 Tax=Solanum commersonii TaxID=4109 RepID=A0A9J5Y994_SOLCO|nr:hypothetical protein H5410_037092 [Solanum commersonii]